MALSFGLALFVGCSGGTERGVSSQGEGDAEGSISGTPQPKLRTIELWAGPEVLEVEVARTREQIRKGMMFRESLAPDEGMLFVFPEPQQVGFYMRNTTIPLSCAYMDARGVIREVHAMEPLDETPIESETATIQYVLEVQQGWFERHGIGRGVKVRTERGTLQETFFR